MARWTTDTIPWHKFDLSKVNMDHLILAKTASVVEYNSADYVQYLRNVFSDDADLLSAIEQWGREEKQHGEVLARWASLVDPAFNFEIALDRFRHSFQVPVDATVSIRGSGSAELIARCIVECGTMSYYLSLAEASDEPVFKAICKQIATDEIHHYGLFFRNLKRYLKKEPLSTLQKLKVAVERSVETSDEELLYAYAASNLRGDIRKEDMPVYMKDYMGRVFGVYSLEQLRKGIQLAIQSVGFEKSPVISEMVARGVYYFFKHKARSLQKGRTQIPTAPMEQRMAQ